MLHRILLRMTMMCRESWILLIDTLKLSCVMLFCAFILLLDPASTYDGVKLASALAETPQGLLLIAVIAAALLDERQN